MADVPPPPEPSPSSVIVRLAANAGGLALAAAVVALALAVAGNVAPPVVAAAPAVARPPATAGLPSARPSPSAVVTPSPSPSPSPAPTATPTPATPPVVAIPYLNERGTYTALNVRPGTAFTAPFAGTVQVRLYQLVDGDIRLGGSDASRPVYPYVTLIGSDKRMIYRLGALTKDSSLAVDDGAVVKVGDPLFRVVASGPSSWNAFYDSGMSSQVLVSLAALPSGRDLDPLPFLPLK